MMKIRIVSLTVFLGIALAGFVFANGGDQRIVEGKYFISLSRAPFTPRVGVKTSFLASFVDLKTGSLVSEDLIVKVRISKLGDAPKGNFVFVEDNIHVTGGVLELPYTFTDSGLHEIFFDFVIASNPGKIYEAPDFLIDVQKPVAPEKSNYIILFLTAVAGFILGFFGRNLIHKGN